jgi:small subunit ribosomal protein S2
LKKIKSNLEGVRKMSRLPGAIVVVDARKEYLALAEAKKLGISTVGIIDTDSNPDSVDVVIPANDDSIRAVVLLLNELADAVAEGKTMAPARQEMMVKPQRPRRIRSNRPTLARARSEKSKEEPSERDEAETATEPGSSQSQTEQS